MNHSDLPVAVAPRKISLSGQFLAAIPRWSASRIHIWLLVVLWVLLVPVTLRWPHLLPLAWQIALGNHTNVVSAAGASIAAASGIAVHREMRARRRVAEATHRLVQDLHRLHIGPPPEEEH